MEFRSLVAGAILLFGVERLMSFFGITIGGIPNAPIVTLAMGIASILVAYYLLRM